MIKVKLNKKLLIESQGQRRLVKLEDFTNNEIFFLNDNLSEFKTKLNRSKVINYLKSTQKNFGLSADYQAFKAELKTVVVSGEIEDKFLAPVKRLGGINSEPSPEPAPEPEPTPEPESGEDDAVEDYEDDEPTERVPVVRDDTEEDTEDVGPVNNQLEMGQKSIEPYIDLFIQENSEEVQKFKNTNNGDALLNSFIGWHREPKAVTQQIRRFQNVLEAHTSQREASTLGGFILDYIKDKNNISEELRILTVSQLISLIESTEGGDVSPEDTIIGKDSIYKFLVSHYYYYLRPEAAVKIVKNILQQYRGEVVDLKENKNSTIRQNFDHFIRTIAAVSLANETLTKAEFSDGVRRDPAPGPDNEDDRPIPLDECEKLIGPEMSQALSRVVKDQNMLGKAARMFANLSLGCDVILLASLGASFLGVSLPFTVPSAILSGTASVATSAIAAGLNLINGQTTEAIFNAIGAIPIFGKIARLLKSFAKAKILNKLLKFPIVQKILKFLKWAKSARQSLNITSKIATALEKSGIPERLAKEIAAEVSDIFFKQIEDRVEQIEQEALSKFNETTGLELQNLEDLEKYGGDQENLRDKLIDDIEKEKQKLIDQFQECLEETREYERIKANSESLLAGIISKLKELLPGNLINLFNKVGQQIEASEDGNLDESIILEYMQEYEASLILSEQKDNYDVRMLQLAGIK